MGTKGGVSRNRKALAERVVKGSDGFFLEMAGIAVQTLKGQPRQFWDTEALAKQMKKTVGEQRQVLPLKIQKREGRPYIGGFDAEKKIKGKKIEGIFVVTGEG